MFYRVALSRRTEREPSIEYKRAREEESTVGEAEESAFLVCLAADSGDAQGIFEIFKKVDNPTRPWRSRFGRRARVRGFCSGARRASVGVMMSGCASN
jgi:hypothetical protein